MNYLDIALHWIMAALSWLLGIGRAFAGYVDELMSLSPHVAAVIAWLLFWIVFTGFDILTKQRKIRPPMVVCSGISTVVTMIVMHVWR